VKGHKVMLEWARLRLRQIRLPANRDKGGMFDQALESEEPYGRAAHEVANVLKDAEAAIKSAENLELANAERRKPITDARYDELVATGYTKKEALAKALGVSRVTLLKYETERALSVKADGPTRS